MHDPQVAGALDMEATLELSLAAGYDKASAQAAASRKGYERLVRNLPS